MRILTLIPFPLNSKINVEFKLNIKFDIKFKFYVYFHVLASP